MSQQIAAHERLLGVAAGARRQGVRPTPAGDVLLQYARQILGKLDEAQRVLMEHEGTGTGVLRVRRWRGSVRAPCCPAP